MRPLLGWLSKLHGGWLAGEIWLKSAACLTSRLKLAFYDLQVPGAIGKCGTQKNAKNNE